MLPPITIKFMRMESKMNPNNFILNSDFASLKNDTGGNTIAVTINSGTTWGTASLNNVILGQANVSVGQANAAIRAIGRTTKSARRGLGTTILFSASTTHLPSSSTFVNNYIAYLVRTSANNLRLVVEAYGVGGGGGPNDFRINETITVTFQFATFLSPFN